MSKFVGFDLVKTAWNSWQKFLADVLLRLIRIFDADSDEDEDCKEVDEGILKLYPSWRVPK
jgi:hypothetical protein